MLQGCRKIYLSVDCVANHPISCTGDNSFHFFTSSLTTTDIRETLMVLHIEWCVCIVPLHPGMGDLLLVCTCKILLLSFYLCNVHAYTYICFISAWLPKNNNNSMFSMVYVVFPLYESSRMSLPRKGGMCRPIYSYNRLVFSSIHLHFCTYTGVCTCLRGWWVVVDDDNRRTYLPKCYHVS